jgi:hypothetical protein
MYADQVYVCLQSTSNRQSQRARCSFPLLAWSVRGIIDRFLFPRGQFSYGMTCGLFHLDETACESHLIFVGT